MVSWLFAVFAAFGLWRSAPRVRRWWIDRARANPRRDPVAGRVSAQQELALELLLSEPPLPEEAVDRALAICAVDDVFSWRAGLRRVAGLVEALPDSDDGRALRAEVALQLGDADRARALAAETAPDHWRACGVRAGLYELDGDVERAESARVAAFVLAPADRRPTAAARLEALRRRHRRVPPATSDLWENAVGERCRNGWDRPR